jgi:hypothetical protein
MASGLLLGELLLLLSEGVLQSLLASSPNSAAAGMVSAEPEEPVDGVVLPSVLPGLLLGVLLLLLLSVGSLQSLMSSLTNSAAANNISAVSKGSIDGVAWTRGLPSLLLGALLLLRAESALPSLLVS